MRIRTTGIGLRIALAALTAVAVTGCGRSPIIPARIEGAIAPTFANLVHVQLSWLACHRGGFDIEVTASCPQAGGGGRRRSRRMGMHARLAGPEREALRAHDLSVGTDGCYTATIDGAPARRADPPDVRGRDVRNLLHTFEGCFDTT